MVEDGSLEVLRILSNASAVIAEGEVLQLITTNDTGTGEDGLPRGHPLQDGDPVRGRRRDRRRGRRRPEAEQQALADYGMNLGIAFQLIDDLLDYSALQAQLGKTVGDDFREGKMSLPVVLAFARANDEEREFWTRTMERMEQEEGDLGQAIALLQKHGVLDETAARARDYAVRAKQALAVFPESEFRAAMMEAVDFAVDRAY